MSSNRRKGKGNPKSSRFSLARLVSLTFRRSIFYSLPFVLAALVAYLGYQDYAVRQQFEGKRWSLPAHVYGSSLELYEGAGLSAETLQWVLDQLKYRQDPDLAAQGAYVRNGREIVIKTREFQYPDKLEPSRLVRVSFDGDQVADMEDLDQEKTLALLRLEPVQIGSFYPALKEDRVLIELRQAPDLLLKALFATEDRDFNRHVGISVRGIARAMWANLRAGGIVQGGSTLTQQLVKNFFLSSERTWWRKINEVVMALIVEARYSKDEILEAYLNEIYLGQDGARAIHGFGLAGQYYFSRSIEELELHQIALLVALVRGPSFYDPFKTPEKAHKRRDLVLQEMVDQGYLSEGLARQAMAAPLDVVADPHQSISRFPAFLDLVKRQLQQEYRAEDLTSEGLRIFTTLDLLVQQRLEESVESTLKKLDARTHSTDLELAAIVTRRETGEIAGLVGSRNPLSSGYNRALDANRQIGSLYKPVVYLTALERGRNYTLATPLPDRAIRIKSGGGWSPKNYDSREHGMVPLHRALAQSYNLATVRLGLEVGVADTLKTLRKLGVKKDVEPVPSLLLGTVELTPFEVTQVYQTLANGGFLTPLRAIQSVLAPNGAPVKRYGLDVKQSADPAAVFLMGNILEEVMREGTGKPAYAHLPSDFTVAGKTGTTNELRDSWFAGFSGDYVGVVWMGKDDNQPAKLTGAQGALQVWASTMRKIGREPLQLAQPDNVGWAWVDRYSGKRTDSGCSSAQRLPFVSGSEPAYGGGCGGGDSGSDRGDSWFNDLF